MAEPNDAPPAAPQVAPAPAPAAPAVPPKPGRPVGRRKWLYRLAAATLIPLVLFGLLEGGLRAGGYGRDTHFFLDGSKLERPGTVIDNREFGKWVFPRGYEGTPFPVPVVMEVEKKPGTFRVFVLGESAAMGFPEPSTSFARVLEVLLQARYPGTRFEVVNAAVVAINSHIVLPIARECAGYQPDLFVVHLGNNEVVGPYGAAGVLGPYSPSRRFIQGNLAVRRTRTGQLLASIVQSAKGEAAAPKTWGGMAMFVDAQVPADDPRLNRIYDHFRDNLAAICKVGTDAGATVAVCTVPSNLRESAPFASAHRPGLSPEQTAAWDALFAEGAKLEAEGKHAAAAEKYLEAEKTDDRYADLQYRLGRCLAAVGRGGEARKRLGWARDLDALRFRTDSTLNDTIRDVAGGPTGCGARLADAERAFDAASPAGGPGENLFLEHVHMNFSGNYLLARTVFEAVAPGLDGRLKPGPRADPLTEPECAERLAYTQWNEAKIVAQVASDLFKQAPFTGQSDRAERAARWDARLKALRARLGPDDLRKVSEINARAVAAREDDWMLRMNYATLLTERDDLAGAEDQYWAVLRVHKHCFPAQTKLGTTMLRRGRPQDAETRFRAALELAPDWLEAELGLAESLGARGKVDEGLAIYERQLAKSPDRGATLIAMGGFLFRAGRLAEARQKLTEGLALKPDHTPTLVQLGDIAMKQGRKDEALGHYEAALKVRPDWPELTAFVAKVRADAPPK